MTSCHRDLCYHSFYTTQRSDISLYCEKNISDLNALLCIKITAPPKNK